MALRFFDCWACYGARHSMLPQNRWSLEHLLEDMEVAGINAALVRHSQSVICDTMQGNLRLIDEIEPHRDRLFPCWTALPQSLNGFAGADELYELMVGHGVKAIQLLPESMRFPIDQRVLSDLARLCAAKQIVVLTRYPELADWSRLATFLDIFSGSPVVIADWWFRDGETAFAVMQHYDNVYIEFSGLQINRGIEVFAREFGPDRLLFGTGQTVKSPGAARSFLDWSFLDEQARQKVASENLCRLLGVTLPPTAVPNSKWDDPIVQEARAGRPLSCQVLDAHHHVLQDGANYAGAGMIAPRGDADGIVELMDIIGVDGAGLMSWDGTAAMDATVGNKVVAGVLGNYPDRFVGLATMNPASQSADEIAEQIETYHSKLGFRGLKPYQPWGNELDYDDQRFESWWRYGEKHHLYGLFHIEAEDIDAVEKLARRFPNLTMLIAHVGSSAQFAERVVERLAAYSNVLFELTYSSVTNGIVEWLVENVTADRVLYGTDTPMRDPRPQTGWVIYTRLSHEDKLKILARNYARILARADLPGHCLPQRFRI